MTRMSATISRTAEHRRRATARHAATTVEAGAASVGPLQAKDAACPTCLAADGDVLDVLPGAAHPGVLPARCPTCGVTSIEYGLVGAIDDVLVEMTGLDRLGREL